MDNTFQIIRRLISEIGLEANRPNYISSLLIQRLISHPDFEMRVHPYGFLHSTLWKGTEGESLRLHIWVDGDPIRNLPTRVHRHAWHLTSYLLFGQLTNELYSVQNNTDGEFRLFSVAYKDQSSIRVPLNIRVDCSLIASHTYKTGDTYNVGIGEYHKTVVSPDSFTATLFVTQQLTSQPLVVGLFGEEEEHPFERSCLNSDNARVITHRLIEELRSQR